MLEDDDVRRAVPEDRDRAEGRRAWPLSKLERRQGCGRPARVDADGRPKLYRSIGFTPAPGAGSPYGASEPRCTRRCASSRTESCETTRGRGWETTPRAPHDQRACDPPAAPSYLRVGLAAARPHVGRRAPRRAEAGRLLAVPRCADMDVMIDRLEDRVPAPDAARPVVGATADRQLRDRPGAVDPVYAAALSDERVIAVLMNQVERAVAEPEVRRIGSLGRGEKRAHRQGRCAAGRADGSSHPMSAEGSMSSPAGGQAVALCVGGALAEGCVRRAASGGSSGREAGAGSAGKSTIISGTLIRGSCLSEPALSASLASDETGPRGQCGWLGRRGAAASSTCRAPRSPAEWAQVPVAGRVAPRGR